MPSIRANASNAGAEIVFKPLIYFSAVSFSKRFKQSGDDKNLACAVV